MASVITGKETTLTGGMQVNTRDLFALTDMSPATEAPTATERKPDAFKLPWV